MNIITVIDALIWYLGYAGILISVLALGWFGTVVAELWVEYVE